MTLETSFELHELGKRTAHESLQSDCDAYNFRLDIRHINPAKEETWQQADSYTVTFLLKWSKAVVQLHSRTPRGEAQSTATESSSRPSRSAVSGANWRLAFT